MSQNLQSLSSDEYIHDPSLRTVSAFALGGVFLLSLNYIFKSPAYQFVVAFIKGIFGSATKSMPNLESLEEDREEKARLRRWIEEIFLEPAETLDPKNLALTLTIFAFNASLGMLGSTLIYSNGQDVLCTFSVAWGGLSAQMIRIVGFMRLSLDLTELGARQWETYLTWFYVLGLAALMMVVTIFEPGTLRAISQFQGLALCYKQHYLQIELLASLLNFFFELYAITRFYFLLVPSFLRFHHKIQALKDIRLGKALSLLILDLLTVVPSAKPISIAADYIPFVVGVIIVLIAFNHEQARVVKSLSRVDSIPSTRMIHIFRGGSTSTIGRTPNSTRRGSTSTSRHLSHPHRRNQTGETPPFSLARLSLESARRKGLKELDIAAANASLNGGPFTQRKAYNPAVAGYAAVPPTSSKRSSRISTDMARRRSNQSGSLEGYSDSPLPPKVLPPVPLVQVPSVEDERGRRYKVASSSRRGSSPTSSVVYGSGIVQTNRIYDPTRDIPDTSRRRRSVVSSNLSTNSTQERVSTSWPRRDDSLSTVQEDTEAARRLGDLHSIAKNRDTFGNRASKNRMESKRRSSVDAGIIAPYILDDMGPPSPSSAPVSRQAIIPVATAPTALSHGLQIRAVATGVSISGVNPMSPSRIRFGARPMRPAILGEGYL